MPNMPRTRPLRMVFSGDFWVGAGGFGLAGGFRKLGWAVHEVDLSRLFGGLGNSIAVRGARRLLAPTLTEVFETDLRNAIKSVRPDVFLSMKGTRISRTMLKWLKERGVLTALFYPDFHFDHPGVSLDSLGDYDLIFTSKTFHVDWLGERFGRDKIFYVPHGYSDDVHWPVLGDVAEADYTVDLQHVGAHSVYKQTWLESLRSACADQSLRVYGARWNRAVKKASLRGIDVGESLYGCAYSMALQDARINISVLMGPHASGWQDNVSQRTFEIPACRGFMLHIDNDEVREFFKPGVEIDVFKSPEELADKVRFYLARPELRQQMIERAYQRCVPAYGYAARAAEMARVMTR